ncbi:hypothetical protein Pmani_004641 [Petrolisthes manimaculis]|uniref:procollagen-proline 4-dioxygenase n=1 Tax=Petrolisthes manimaculis TaxID=1843537 RepID=A0AAE1UNU0_9EUCA|nr:hypothetical protein Pmani_004641 [Petrolisthes manimaculis]
MKTIIESLGDLSIVLQGYVSSWEEVEEGGEHLRWEEGDPAAAFSLLRHIGLGWTTVDQALHQAQHTLHGIEELARRADEEPLPNNDDVSASAEAVTRLAHVYDFNTTLLAQSGLVQGLHQYLHHHPSLHQYHALSVSDLAHLGLAAVNKGFFSVGVEFLGAARTRAVHSHTHTHRNTWGEYTLKTLDDLLGTSIKVHNHVLEMRGPRSLNHATASTPYGNHGGGVLDRGGVSDGEELKKQRMQGEIRSQTKQKKKTKQGHIMMEDNKQCEEEEWKERRIHKSNRKGEKHMGVKEREGHVAKEEENKEEVRVDVVLGVEYLKRHGNKTWMVDERPLVERLQMERLCRGEELRSSSVTSKLVCRYMNGGSAWLLLAPFKVEQVALDPSITLVYGVLGREEATQVRVKAVPHLHQPFNNIKPTRRHTSTTATDHKNTNPTLKHTWMREEEAIPLQKLGRRLHHLLGVAITDDNSEPYMVADYGLGGSYDPHRDTHGPLRTPPRATVGERMATVLTFLQPPAQGGLTVFPWVGAGVGGVAGAAVVWWNLLASHEHDFLTRHAACPVLRGYKWIMTKWVGYRGQWRSLPCPADPSRKVTRPSH